MSIVVSSTAATFDTHLSVHTLVPLPSSASPEGSLTSLQGTTTTATLRGASRNSVLQLLVASILTEECATIDAYRHGVDTCVATAILSRTPYRSNTGRCLDEGLTWSVRHSAVCILFAVALYDEKFIESKENNACVYYLPCLLVSIGFLSIDALLYYLPLSTLFNSSSITSVVAFSHVVLSKNTTWEEYIYSLDSLNEVKRHRYKSARRFEKELRLLDQHEALCQPCRVSWSELDWTQSSLPL